MKNYYTMLLILTLGFSISAQNEEVKYRRSSLHTILVESENFPKKEIVINAFNNSPFPDKYDNHAIGEKSFNPSKYGFTNDEKDQLSLSISKYLEDAKIAKKLVSKWFNRQPDGSFDSNLIAERGIFNASFLETKTAESSSDGIAILKTAGFELIGNTFVVINKFKFVPNEPIAAGIRDAAKIAALKLPMGQELAMAAADAAYEKGKEGYSIWATAYLYKLVWDEETINTFYTDMYFEKDNLDIKKKEVFDNSNLFKLEFVGDESASSIVTFSLSQKRTEEQIIELATVRIIDNVYAKLQKKYDVFKTKTPLFTGEPITAKIGKKEGLEGGEKFEVLEQVMDPKTGLVEYKNLGTIKVDKKLIWDNTYKSEETIDENGESSKSTIDRTTFSGGKKYYSGLLIRQLK